jgi:hypothetical protein
MRIPGTKVYRAFPEFDRFTDEQCERFLAAAVQLGWRRVLRWVITGVAGVVLFVVAVVPSLFARVALEKPLALSGLLTFVADLLSVLVPSCVGGFGGVLVRDVLLRQHLRRLINTRGSCSACGYRLLGLPVSEANTVACPECGHVSEVDPSLGELTIREGTEGGAGAGGAGAVGTGKVERLFTPKQEVVKPGFWTATRVEWLKRWAKRGAITAFAVVLAGGGFALYRFIIADLDASAAKAMYDPDNLMTRHIRSVQPEGTLASEPNGWDLVIKVHEEMKAIDAKLLGEYAGRAKRIDPDGNGLWLDMRMWGAAPVRVPDSNNSEDGVDTRREQLWNLNTELPRRAVRRYEFAGLFDQLDQLAGIRRYEPDYRQAATNGGVPGNRTDLRQLLELSSACWARLRAALADGDQAGALRTVKTMIALHRRGLSGIQVFEIAYGHYSMANLNTALGPFLVTADEATLAELSKLCGMADPTGCIASAGRGEVVLLNQVLADVYSDPSNTRWGMLSLHLNNLMPLTIGKWFDSRPLGRLQSNLDENAATLKRFVQLSEALPRNRPTLTDLSRPPTLWDDVVIGDHFIAKWLVRTDQVHLHWRALETRIALERYKRRHGSYPGTLDLLVPEFLAAVPQEPWSPGPLRYKVLPAPDAKGLGYVLYSIGEDGVDDGGTVRPASGLMPGDGIRGVSGTQSGDIDLNPADVPFKFKK